ncbi:GreA/GreB family elongation factor [Methylophilaceae bacterium]|nr:GreA/GreB family elongation factor [Methylophilaceae bacterium]
MSRAFVKENDMEHAGIDIPERPISTEVNYITPNGLKQLKNILDTLDAERQTLIFLDDSMSKQKKMRIERDIRYYASRIKTAILIQPDKQAENKVLFGALIELEDEKGETESYEIVGEDEADLALRKLSYVSPLAKSVMGNSLGDEVTLIKPTATVTLTIKNITYNK